MSVFVLLYSSLGGSEHNFGVFSTLEKAREASLSNSRIEEWTLDNNEVKFHSSIEG